MFDVFKYLGKGGVLRGWLDELAIRVHVGRMIKVLSGAATTWGEHPIFYSNESPVFLYLPDNCVSTPVIRLDRKKQIVRIHLIRYGWRRFLERVYDLFAHRYVDMPLADVECRDGKVISIEDRREFLKYHA